MFVRIRRGRGGSADGLVIETANSIGDFTRRIVVLDNDKSEAEMSKAREEAKNRKIELIENTPCLEAVLMSVLEKETPTNKGSWWYKNEFQSKYIERRKRDDPTEYTKVFSRQILENERARVVELNRLIDLMEGKSGI
jgi:hypothetical protein